MSMLKNKLIISIIGFYLFWVGAMPFIVSGTVTALCKNISHNTKYNIEVVKPRAYFSILPTVRFDADKVLFNIENKDFEAELSNFKIRLRLLPLLTGRFHINSLAMNALEFNSTLENNLELDKDFFYKLESTRFKLDSFEIKDFKTQFYRKDIKTPIYFSGHDFLYSKHNRFVKLKLNSELKIRDAISTTSLNLFLPKNNDIKKTVFEIAVEAGFKGTLEDWERAVANEELNGEEAVECRCSGCQNRITLGDAIIIAQTHYFAVYYKDDNFGWADIAKLASEDVENWYIEISPEDVFNDGVEYIYKGQCYIYTINKESGKIIEINSSGE